MWTPPRRVFVPHTLVTTRMSISLTLVILSRASTFLPMKIISNSYIRLMPMALLPSPKLLMECQYSLLSWRSRKYPLWPWNLVPQVQTFLSGVQSWLQYPPFFQSSPPPFQVKSSNFWLISAVVAIGMELVHPFHLVFSIPPSHPSMPLVQLATSTLWAALSFMLFHAQVLETPPYSSRSQTIHPLVLLLWVRLQTKCHSQGIWKGRACGQIHGWRGADLSFKSERASLGRFVS